MLGLFTLAKILHSLLTEGGFSVLSADLSGCLVCLGGRTEPSDCRAQAHEELASTSRVIEKKCELSDRPRDSVHTFQDRDILGTPNRAHGPNQHAQGDHRGNGLFACPTRDQLHQAQLLVEIFTDMTSTLQH